MTTALKLTDEDVTVYQDELDILEEKHTINNDEWCSLMTRFLHTFGAFNENIKIDK